MYLFNSICVIILSCSDFEEILCCKEEITWIKNGDFNRKFNSGGDLIQMVEYLNQKNPKQTISICGYRDGDIGIIIRREFKFSSKDKDAFLDAIADALIVQGYPIEFDKIIDNHIKLVLTPEKIYDFVLFLNTVDRFLPIQNIKKELFETLKIKAIPNEKEFYDSINTLILDNKIDDALVQAKSVEDDNILWIVAQLLEKNEKYMEAIGLYQDIPATNPHYRKANEQAEKIMLQYEIATPSLSAKEKHDNLESKVRFMLRANNPDKQRLLDQRFAELCGDKSLIPAINTVQINEDTLIALAHHTSSLQKQNQELLAKLAKLTSNLSTTPGTFFYNTQASSEEREIAVSASPINDSTN